MFPRAFLCLTYFKIQSWLKAHNTKILMVKRRHQKIKESRADFAQKNTLVDK